MFIPCAKGKTKSIEGYASTRPYKVVHQGVDRRTVWQTDMINWSYNSIERIKHRHQRCKAPSICKTFFITTICRLKESSQKQDLSHNVFLATAFTQRLSNNIFLPTFFSKRISHTVVLTTISQKIHLLITSSYTRNLSTFFGRLNRMPCRYTHCCPYMFVHIT